MYIRAWAGIQIQALKSLLLCYVICENNNDDALDFYILKSFPVQTNFEDDFAVLHSFEISMQEINGDLPIFILNSKEDCPWEIHSFKFNKFCDL